jgi:hypothetical protein
MAHDASVGKTGKCPGCGRAFKVPTAAEAGPAAAAASPELVTVACPHCNTRLRMKAADAAPGRRATCAKCRQAFTMPERPPAPAQKPPAAPPPAAPPPAAPPPAAPPQPHAAQPGTGASDASAWTAPPVPSVSAAAPEPAPAPAAQDPPTSETLDEPAAYPWETPAALVTKAEAYDARNLYQSFAVKVNEFLNSLMKNETFKSPAEGELRIYRDIVGVTDRPPGCLGQLIMRLPGWLQTCLYWTIGGGCVTLIFLPLTLLIMALTSPIWVPMIFIDKWRMNYVARKIRLDPHSSYAIRKLHKYAALGPRYWERGDIVQVVRLDCRRRLFKRSLILFLQDSPLPETRSLLDTSAFLLLSRLFRGQRRIYVVDVEAGPAQADAAAASAALVLNLPVLRAKFSFNNLKLEKA